IYSQFQVAQVGTYAYYLLAVEEALARDQHFLKELLFSLDECTIGAAAGCGTSFSINRELIARLLGFSRCSPNALDAVANRDLALRVLSSLSILGTTLSRMAQDYQLWTTQEFAFFDLPDNLCGSSSMMPQKKNPYLFEVIKGKSATLNGMLVQALTCMHNVPFSNSVETSVEALQGIDIVLKNMSDILLLTELLVSKARPVKAQFNKSINKGVAVATGVAEYLVKEKKLPFREAHFKIGEKISRAISQQVDPLEEVFSLVSDGLRAQKAIFWAHANEYGGGPGKNTTIKSYQSAKRRLRIDVNWIKSIERRWESAEIKLQREIKKII
ncbi:MAG: argininosuccinate lyase, partial [Gammaproteobacteria bacterium]